MKYFFAQGALVIFLLGMVLDCGKSVDVKLSMQIVSGCDSGEYNTLVTGITQYCLSILNAADNSVYGQPLCSETIQNAAYKVDVKKLIQDLGSGATVRIVVTGLSSNVPKAQGVSYPVKLDPTKDNAISIPFFRLVGLTSTSTTWDGNEFMTLANSVVTSCEKMPFPAQGHTATLFPSGHVMVVGSGSALPTTITTAAFLIDPYNQSFLPIQPTPTTTETLHIDNHTASLLSDGRVVIVGGRPYFVCGCPPPPPLCFCLLPAPLKTITVIDGAKMTQPYDPTQVYNQVSVTDVGSF